MRGVIQFAPYSFHACTGRVFLIPLSSFLFLTYTSIYMHIYLFIYIYTYTRTHIYTPCLFSTRRITQTVRSFLTDPFCQRPMRLQRNFLVALRPFWSLLPLVNATHTCFSSIHSATHLFLLQYTRPHTCRWYPGCPATCLSGPCAVACGRWCGGPSSGAFGGSCDTCCAAGAEGGKGELELEVIWVMLARRKRELKFEVRKFRRCCSGEKNGNWNLKQENFGDVNEWHASPRIRRYAI